MKIKSIFFSVLALVLILSSCNVATPSTPTSTPTLTPDSPTETKMPKPEPTVTIPNDQVLFPLDVYDDNHGIFESELSTNTIGGMLTINNLFPIRPTIEDDVPKKITYKLGNTEYNLEYMWSAPYWMGFLVSDVYVDYYKFEEIDLGASSHVAFKHKTTDLIDFSLSGSGINAPKIEFTTCEEYIEYFSQVLGDSVDLSEFKLKCTTQLHTSGNAGNGIETIDGFDNTIVQNNEYKKLIFDFTKTVGGLNTGNKILVYVNSGHNNGLIIRNHSTNYDYNSNDIGIYQNDIDLALSLTQKWAEQSFGECENLKFVYIKHLYGNPYIVISFTADHHDIAIGTCFVYVDFRRMIQ